MEIHQDKFAAYLQELQTLQSLTDFYEYEKKFSEIHTRFGKEMLALNIEQQQLSVNKKVYKKKSRPNLEK